MTCRNEPDFRVMVESARDGVLVVDSSGRHLYANRRMAEISGYSTAELLEIGLQGLAAPSELATLADRLRRRVCGEPVPDLYETAIQRRDGTLVPVEVSCFAIQWQGSPASAVSLRELTQRRRIMAALEASEGRLRGTLAAMVDLVFVFDPQGRFVFHHMPRQARLYVPPEQFLGLHHTEVMPPHTHAQVEAALAANREGRIADAEYWLDEEAGRIWCSAKLSPIFAQGVYAGSVAVVRDITERQRAEEELRRTAERLRLLSELDRAVLQAPSLAAIGQAAVEGVRRLVPCDRASVLLFSAAAEDPTFLAVSSSLAGSPAPGSICPLAPEMRAEMAKGQILFLEDLTRHPSRTPAWDDLLQFGGRAFLLIPLLAEGELIGCLNLIWTSPRSPRPDEARVAEEIAHPLAFALWQSRLHERIRRHAEDLQRRVDGRTAELQARVREAEELNRTLAAANRELESATRLLAESNTELKAFSRSLSHDLGAPIRALQGFSQALLADAGPDLAPRARRHALRIAGAAERLGNQVEELLAYSSAGRVALEPEPIDLASLVEGVREDMASEIDRTGARIELRPPWPALSTHRALLAQILANLLSNGLKHVPPGRPPHVVVRAEDRPAGVRIWVEDNGVGIPAEDQARIFEPFERLPAAAGSPGSGLGLAIVRRGAERLGGRAGVLSEPGRGSRFWIELPSIAGRPETAGAVSD